MCDVVKPNSLNDFNPLEFLLCYTVIMASGTSIHSIILVLDRIMHVVSNLHTMVMKTCSYLTVTCMSHHHQIKKENICTVYCQKSYRLGYNVNIVVKYVSMITACIPGIRYRQLNIYDLL